MLETGGNGVTEMEELQGDGKGEAVVGVGLSDGRMASVQNLKMYKHRARNGVTQKMNS